VSLRSELADFLRARLPGYKVLAYQYEMDNSSMPVVMVHRSKVERHPMHRALWESSLTVSVLVPPMIAGEALEDAADAALLEVLTALQDADNVEWTEAERVSYANFAGWQVPLTTTTPNEILI
jgi:hypothetical protein